jgi:hypothetical protein
VRSCGSPFVDLPSGSTTADSRWLRLEKTKPNPSLLIGCRLLGHNWFVTTWVRLLKGGEGHPAKVGRMLPNALRLVKCYASKLFAILFSDFLINRLPHPGVLWIVHR